ncbi:hypothetical protein PVAND_017277 [Polypedilum vanderplanki]|uniref:Uncharacterized protein n=1 Tax=Polypedilum vanderplanki TaxID=319348 RepID=A0A9J6BIZ2_POLVA|nr:hypothetical protein PVAND_017277 [Polypedilum vanderplanki]
MKQFFFLKFLIILIFTFKVHSEDKIKKCIEKFETFVHPTKCCDFPIFSNKNTSAEHCFDENKENLNFTCEHHECEVEKLGIFINGKFNIENTVKWLLHNFTDQVKKQWENVAIENMKKCFDEAETNQHKIECKYPDYPHILTDCLYQMNFLKCPTFNSTDECKKVKSFIETNECREHENSKYIMLEFWVI